MTHELIILWRNILLRCFVVGIFLAVILFVATITLWHTASAWVTYFFQVDEKALGRIVLHFFVMVRLILVFVFLTPAIALGPRSGKQNKL